MKMQSADLAREKVEAFDVSEIYFSLQGESSLAGTPTIFIRLFRCNLRCNWCDSFYAVEGGDFTSLPVEQLVNRVSQMAERGGSHRTGVTHICWTGGEPLLQWRRLVQAVEKMPERLQHTIETDGEIPLGPVNRALEERGLRDRVRYIMDVKCPGSGMKAKLAFDNLRELDRRDEVKFVILDRRDYEFARRIISSHEIPCEHILLSAVNPAHQIHLGLDPSTLAGWILEDRLDVRLQVQLHKILWPGKERGI